MFRWENGHIDLLSKKQCQFWERERERGRNIHLFCLYLGEKLVEAKLLAPLASALGMTCRLTQSSGDPFYCFYPAVLVLHEFYCFPEGRCEGWCNS